MSIYLFIYKFKDGHSELNWLIYLVGKDWNSACWSKKIK